MTENPTGESPSSANPISGAAKPSGLRNPAAAVRGAGAGALAGEGLIMLLAIVPVRVLGGHLTGLAITFVVAMAVICFALAGALRRSWGWYAGGVVQVILFASGFVFHPSLAVLGVLFGLLWLYVLHVRRTVLR